MKTNKTNLFIYLSISVIFVLLIFVFTKVSFLYEFSSAFEGKTFDLRQKITSKHKIPKDNPIKILALDTKSYEFINDTYGEWPVKREYWADLINEIEKYNPKLIVIDFMFPKKSNKGGSKSDIKFINAVNSNNNLITGMLFDFEKEENRTPKNLPLALQNNVKNGEIIQNNSQINFKNCQPILNEILEKSTNTGSVNFTRESDGIIRYMPVFVYYKGSFYKNMSTLSALKYLGKDTNSFEVKNNFINIDLKHKIPINDTARAIMNWYKEDAFQNISLSDIHKAISKNDKEFLEKNIKDKVIYIGATASLLNDIKSSPISSLIPGVEVHATYFANFINNDFIYHVPLFVDVLIAFILGFIAVIFVNKINNIVKSLLYTLGIFGIYCITAYALMSIFDIWVGIILPFTGVTIFFITSYILKYILKEKDYEQTYYLAVTDVMTQLYNHRYFQEQMTLNTQNYNRYQTEFSLIMTDIDFFKKFNDTYGHQSGDAVLKQVAHVMKSCVRSTDIPCRYGGEEMAVILTNTNKKDAISTANKICETVRNTKVTLATGDIVNVTISVGVATMPEDGLTPKDLIQACDKRLYVAKENGRNQVVSE